MWPDSLVQISLGRDSLSFSVDVSSSATCAVVDTVIA